MEYLSGGSLKDRLVQSYKMDKFLILGRQICEGLSFAHRNKVIHGDLRPSNILFTNAGLAKITDFGLGEHYVPPLGKVNWYNPTGEPKSVKKFLPDLCLNGKMPPFLYPHLSNHSRLSFKRC